MEQSLGREEAEEGELVEELDGEVVSAEEIRLPFVKLSPSEGEVLSREIVSWRGGTDVGGEAEGAIGNSVLAQCSEVQMVRLTRAGFLDSVQKEVEKGGGVSFSGGGF